ncbi:hypothetical protein CSUI_006058, partial [Cystoisospora suis]
RYPSHHVCDAQRYVAGSVSPGASPHRHFYLVSQAHRHLSTNTLPCGGGGGTPSSS